jgi:hypothetical protein
MLIKGEITLLFTEVFELQSKVHYILQVIIFIVLYTSQKMYKL